MSQRVSDERLAVMVKARGRNLTTEFDDYMNDLHDLRAEHAALQGDYEAAIRALDGSVANGGISWICEDDCSHGWCVRKRAAEAASKAVLSTARARAATQEKEVGQ